MAEGMNHMSLSRLEDYVALCRLKASYCRHIDEKAWMDLADLLTHDFVMDAAGPGHPPVVGRDAAIDRIRMSIETARTAHQVHMPEIDVDGDSAHGIWAMQDRAVWGNGRPSIVGYGHYREHYVREAGRWKIARLQLTRLHIDFHPDASAVP
jgi:hypothetical protein